MSDFGGSTQSAGTYEAHEDNNLDPPGPGLHSGSGPLYNPPVTPRALPAPPAPQFEAPLSPASIAALTPSFFHDNGSSGGGGVVGEGGSDGSREGMGLVGRAAVTGKVGGLRHSQHPFSASMAMTPTTTPAVRSSPTNRTAAAAAVVVATATKQHVLIESPPKACACASAAVAPPTSGSHGGFARGVDDVPTSPRRTESAGMNSHTHAAAPASAVATHASTRVELQRQGSAGSKNNSGDDEDAMETDLDFIRELTWYRGARVRQDEYEFALVLKPNDEYRDAVEVLELALELRDGSSPVKKASPTKLKNARRVRESLAGMQQPPDLTTLGDNPSMTPYTSQSGLAGRKAGPPQVRPGLSEGCEGNAGGGRRQRLSLLDDLQEEEGRLTARRKKELDRKKMNRLFHFVEKLKEGVIVRRHRAHHTCDQIVLQSTDDCRTIVWKPLLAAKNKNATAYNGGAGGGGGALVPFLRLFRGGAHRLHYRAESIKTANIAVVLPATDPDPSHAGFFGTRALRLSEDIPNPARTFSLLYGDWGVGGGGAVVAGGAGGGRNGTLDLECDDDGMYAMLFQGFLLLHMQTAHVQGRETRLLTPPARERSPPNRSASKSKTPRAALDNMEAGSGARGRSRPFGMRSKSPSERKVSPAQGEGTPGGEKRESSTADEDVSGPGAANNGGGVGGGMLAGSRASLKKSLKFLPDVIGGLSSSRGGGGGRRSPQQTSSQVMSAAPPEFFLGWTSPGTQIWSRLRMAGLEVEKLYSLDRRHVLLKIRLPRSKLEEVAETMRLKLRRRDGTIGRFKKIHRSSFTESLGGDLFRSGESQKVIDHLIRSKIKDGGAELGDRSELGKHICKRMPLHNQARLEALYSAWVVYWRAPNQQQQEQHRQLKLRQRKTTIGSTTITATPPRTSRILDTSSTSKSTPPLSHCTSNSANTSPAKPGAAVAGNGGVPLEDRSSPSGIVPKMARTASASSKGHRGMLDQEGDCDDEEGERLTRAEALREKVDEAAEAVAAAGRLAMVVLKGSMWQPLELIADYYGEATAFYFAWMGFYTQGLVVPSIFGVIVFAAQVHSRSLDHPLMPIYAVFVIVWSSALLVLWRQRCSELAYRWGVLHFEQEEQTRSQFFGKQTLDTITGRFMPEYPAWRRWMTYALTMPVMVGFTGAVLALMFMVFVHKDGISNNGKRDLAFWANMLIHPMLYGITIPILYGVCKKLGVFLNNLENHKTENKYRNALIVKVFSFRFVTVFASLYHYAFLSRNGTANNKLLRLAVSLCSFMTIGQWWYMIWMCYIPGRVQNWKLGKLKIMVSAEREKLEKADAVEAAGGGGGGAGEASRGVRRKLLDEAGDHLWEEAVLKEYNLADVFDDYTMSLIQFGYVALFSAAFPLAPLLAMINNLVQTRVDAYKLCKTRRRPIALKSGGIGVWDNVLQLMTVIAVITNCALIGVTSSHYWPSHISRSTKILVVVIAEHIILFLKYWLEHLVPRVPHKVQRALQRERAEREQKGVFKDSPDDDDSKFNSSFYRPVASAAEQGSSSSSAAAKGRRIGGGAYFPSVSSVFGVAAGGAIGGGVGVGDTSVAAYLTPTGRSSASFTANPAPLSSTASVSTTPAATPPGVVAVATGGGRRADVSAGGGCVASVPRERVGTVKKPASSASVAGLS